jgi:membrane-associated phospholipid phosphatase
MMLNRVRPASAGLAILALASWSSFAPLPAAAADTFTLNTALVDTGEYLTAPLRWDREDWAYFGVSAAALAAAHEYDDNVRAHFATGSRAVLDSKDKNSLRDALPTLAIVGGTWVYAEFLDDKDGYRETWGMVESGVLSTATGEILKVAAGRERPNVVTTPDHWRQGGDSFPSVHTTAAFAIGTVFAESGNDEYRWLRRIIGYGIAGGTAYTRLHENQHWLSDTVAGAALGIATARFVLNRHSGTTPDATAGRLEFQPAKNGWALNYVVDLE